MMMIQGEVREDACADVVWSELGQRSQPEQGPEISCDQLSKLLDADPSELGNACGHGGNARGLIAVLTSAPGVGREIRRIGFDQ